MPRSLFPPLSSNFDVAEASESPFPFILPSKRRQTNSNSDSKVHFPFPQHFALPTHHQHHIVDDLELAESIVPQIKTTSNGKH